MRKGGGRFRGRDLVAPSRINLARNHSRGDGFENSRSGLFPAQPTAPGAAMRRKRVARRRRIQAPLRSQMVTTPAPPRPLTAATPGAPRQGTPRASGRPASRRGGGGAVPSPPAVPGGGVRPPTARPRSVRGAGRQDAPGRLQRRLHLSLSPYIGASSPVHTASPRPGSGRPHWSRRQQTRGGHPLWPRGRTTRGCRRLR